MPQIRPGSVAKGSGDLPQVAEQVQGRGQVVGRLLTAQLLALAIQLRPSLTGTLTASSTGSSRALALDDDDRAGHPAKPVDARRPTPPTPGPRRPHTSRR